MHAVHGPRLCPTLLRMSSRGENELSVEPVPPPLRLKDAVRVRSGGQWKELGLFASSGDLETDALTLTPDADFQTILKDADHPLHAKAQSVQSARDERMVEILRKSSTPFTDILTSASYGGSDPWVPTPVRRSVPLEDAVPVSLLGHMPTHQERTNELLAAQLDASNAQHDAAIARMEDQTRALSTIADLARQDAEAARKDAADSRRTMTVQTWIAIGALVVALLTAAAPFIPGLPQAPHVAPAPGHAPTDPSSPLAPATPDGS